MIIERLVGHISNGIGRDFATDLKPLPYPETVVRRLAETAEAREDPARLGGHEQQLLQMFQV